MKSFKLNINVQAELLKFLAKIVNFAEDKGHTKLAKVLAGMAFLFVEFLRAFNKGVVAWVYVVVATAVVSLFMPFFTTLEKTHEVILFVVNIFALWAIILVIWPVLSLNDWRNRQKFIDPVSFESGKNPNFSVSVEIKTPVTVSQTEVKPSEPAVDAEVAKDTGEKK